MTLFEEWIAKAEADFKGAVALNRLRKTPLPDLVCYHCQQCTEKYLKALIINQGVAPKKTHDLEDLLTECSVYHPSLSALRSGVSLLNPYSMQFRYPGDTATMAEAKAALTTLRKMRTVLRKKIGF